MIEIKLVLTDIDGVWTDGGMYYGDDGHEWKKFNTSDSVGVALLKEAGIEVGIITGENINVVARRANKLGVEILKMGAQQKLVALREISELKNIPFINIAYIGDDILDIPIIEKVGLSAVPANAPSYVAQYADWVLNKKGGDGAFREFAEKILHEMNLFHLSLERWLFKLRIG